MSVIFALAVTLVAAPTPAAPPAFLFDALQSKSSYRPAWDKMFKEVQPTPDWLLQFSKNFDGVSGAMTPVTIDGKTYLQSFVCKPTDCAEHKFTVLFDAAGAHAFGALGGHSEPPAFFGAPSKDEQDTLAKGF